MNMKKFYMILIAIAEFVNLVSGQESKAKQIVMDYFTWVDAGKIEEVGQLLHDQLSVMAPFSPTAMDKAAWKQVGLGFGQAFPDMKHEIVDWFANGDKVAVRGYFKGTNKGPMMGMPATGNWVSTSFNTLFTLDGHGKIKAIYVQFDQKDFEAQLMKGIMPGSDLKMKILDMMKAADAGDAEKFGSYWALDSKNYFGGQEGNLEEMKKRILGFKMAFPDAWRNIKEITVTGNKVFINGEFTGTNDGMFMGKPATHRKVKLSHLGEYHFNADGKITMGRVEADYGNLMSQLYN